MMHRQQNVKHTF